MCAADAMSKFIEEYDGSLGKAERAIAGELRDTHDACIAEFNRLDSDIAEPYNSPPALYVAGDDLEFVRGRYEVLVRQEVDVSMATAYFFC